MCFNDNKTSRHLEINIAVLKSTEKHFNHVGSSIGNIIWGERGQGELKFS